MNIDSDEKNGAENGNSSLHSPATCVYSNNYNLLYARCLTSSWQSKWLKRGRKRDRFKSTSEKSTELLQIVSHFSKFFLQTYLLKVQSLQNIAQSYFFSFLQESDQNSHKEQLNFYQLYHISKSFFVENIHLFKVQSFQNISQS